MAPFHFTSYAGKAEVLVEMNKDKEALEIYNHLVNVSDNLVGFSGRARLLLKLNRMEEALQDYLSIHKIRPESLEALNGAAECYLNLNKKTEAEEFYKVPFLNTNIKESFRN